MLTIIRNALEHFALFIRPGGLFAEGRTAKAAANGAQQVAFLAQAEGDVSNSQIRHIENYTGCQQGLAQFFIQGAKYLWT